MHGTPNLNPDYLQFIADAHALLVDMPETDRNRLSLALRWINAAIRDRRVDAFIKYWLAIETLGMPDDTNIRPISETLARVYNISYAEARDRFLVGRLYGRRSRIVHEEDLTPVDAQVLIYLFAIFMDLLRAELGIQPSYRAGRVLENPDFVRISDLIG